MFSKNLGYLFLLLWLEIVHSFPLIEKREQSDALEPKKVKLRPLPWGEINFIHSTDTHGWLAGHVDDENYSADWGDYFSFITHMRKNAKDKNVDLLVIDSGDLHDGTGLSDATPLDGEISQEWILKSNIDLHTIGNHELYKPDVANDTYFRYADTLGPNKFIVSNVDFYRSDINEWVPFGSKFIYFKTPVKKLNVLAFAFIFNFDGYTRNNTRVTHVQDSIKQDWFKDALNISPTPDLILMIGHQPIRDWPEMDILLKAIRNVHPNIPIHFFGGHTHIRDYVILDKNAVAIESGKYDETIGWASISGFDNTSLPSFNFSRSYIDFNLHSFSTHSNTYLTSSGTNIKNLPAFDTDLGKQISNEIYDARKQLNLTFNYGCVPHSFYLKQASFPSNYSLLSLMQLSVLPTIKSFSNISRDHLPRHTILNTGSLRYHLNKGFYTTDTAFQVSPFKDKWVYIPDVPIKIAKRIVPLLNKFQYVWSTTKESKKIYIRDLYSIDENYSEKEKKQDALLGFPPLHRLIETYGSEMLGVPDSFRMVSSFINKQTQSPFTHKIPTVSLFFKSKKFPATQYDKRVLVNQEEIENVDEQEIKYPGHVTHDDLGDTGDDTPHIPQKNFELPNVIGTEENFQFATAEADGVTSVDLIVNKFTSKFVVSLLEGTGINTSFVTYSDSDTTSILTNYIIENWKCD